MYKLAGITIVWYTSYILIKRGLARLAQLPCTDETEQERPRRIAGRHVMIVTSKMSCAQKTRESCERLSPK